MEVGWGCREWENTVRVRAARGGDLPRSIVGDCDVDLFWGSPAWGILSSLPALRSVKSEISSEWNLGGGARGDDVTLEMERGVVLSERGEGWGQSSCVCA